MNWFTEMNDSKLELWGLCASMCTLSSLIWKGAKNSQCAMWTNAYAHLRELFSFLTFSHYRVAAVPSHIIHININSWHMSEREQENLRRENCRSLTSSVLRWCSSPILQHLWQKHKTNRVKKKKTLTHISSCRQESKHTVSVFSLRLVRVLALMPTLYVCVCV